jgi:hypothetical protein
MLNFINPKHVPGSGSKPWITIQDTDDAAAIFSMLKNFKLEDGNPTDGYVIRDMVFTRDEDNGDTILTTKLVKAVLNQPGTHLGTFATKADLNAFTIPPSAKEGDYALVTEDETPISLPGWKNPTPRPTYYGVVYVLDSTRTFQMFDFHIIRYVVRYQAFGHTTIDWQFVDQDLYHFNLRWNNDASAYQRVQNVSLPSMPLPNDIITIDHSVISNFSEWVYGDIVEVGAGSGQSFVQQFVGVYNGLIGGQNPQIRVLASGYSFGGVKQYATRNDFPTSGDDVSVRYLYVATDTQYGYTWNGTEYKILTDISGKADKYIIPNTSTTINVADVYNLYISLKAEADESATGLEEHVNNGDIHVTKEQKDAWSAAVTALAQHTANLDIHFDAHTPSPDPTLGKIRKEDVRQHLKDPSDTSPDYHFNAARLNKLDAAINQAAVDTALEPIKKDIADIEEIIAGLSGLGRYLFTVDQYAATGTTDPPGGVGDITYTWLVTNYPGVQVNDFINVRVDEDHDKASTRYILSQKIDATQTLVWEFDVKLNQNISDLMVAFSLNDWTAGWIPLVIDQKTLTGKGINPTTLATVAALTAHETAKTTAGSKGIHLDQDDRDLITGTAADLEEHVDDDVRHITAEERSDWEGAVSDLSTHIADNVKHITAAERTAWNAKVSSTQLEAEAEAREDADDAIAGDISALDTRVTALEKKGGLYLGKFANIAALPTTAGNVGDFALVEVSAVGVPAIMRISAKSGSNVNTWTNDLNITKGIIPDYANLSLVWYAARRAGQSNSQWDWGPPQNGDISESYKEGDDVGTSGTTNIFEVPETAYYQFRSVGGSSQIMHQWVYLMKTKDGGITDANVQSIVYNNYDETNRASDSGSPGMISQPVLLVAGTLITMITYTLYNRDTGITSPSTNLMNAYHQIWKFGSI